MTLVAHGAAERRLCTCRGLYGYQRRTGLAALPPCVHMHTFWKKKQRVEQESQHLALSPNPTSTYTIKTHERVTSRGHCRRHSHLLRDQVQEERDALVSGERPLRARGRAHRVGHPLRLADLADRLRDPLRRRRGNDGEGPLKRYVKMCICRYRQRVKFMIACI
jgi:hypothetical protein